MTHTARPRRASIAIDREESPSPRIIALLAQEIQRLPRAPGCRRRVATAIELETGQLAALLAA